MIHIRMKSQTPPNKQTNFAFTYNESIIGIPRNFIVLIGLTNGIVPVEIFYFLHTSKSYYNCYHVSFLIFFVRVKAVVFDHGLSWCNKQ